MGIMALFKKKESSLLDTPPPIQTINQQKPLELDLPPMPMSFQHAQLNTPSMMNFKQSELQSNLDSQEIDSQQMAPKFTFPDIPEEELQEPRPLSIAPKDNIDYEFDINENLFSHKPILPASQVISNISNLQPNLQLNLQKTSNVYKDKDSEINTNQRINVIVQKPITKPIFISLQQYKRAMNNIETMYNDVTIASDTVFRFFQLYNDMDNTFNEWQSSLDRLQEDMVDLDKALFKFA